MNHRTVSFRGKRVKIFAAALLLLTVTTCSLGLAESGWMLNTLANVYESHDLASMVIAEAQPGQIYTILDSTERNRWIKVSYIDTQFGNQVVGWIKEDILETPPTYYEEPAQQSYEHQGDSRANSNTLSNPNASSSISNSFGLGYVLCESLSGRMEPNVTSNVIANFTHGTTFSITEVIDTWYKVSIDGTIGWVNGQYVLVNPQYYTTQSETAAYAYPGSDPLRVGLIDANTQLAIIADLADYYCVSVRGASAFIKK